jgi:hypothetical protein
MTPLERSRDGERHRAALDYAARNRLDVITATDRVFPVESARAIDHHVCRGRS